MITYSSITNSPTLNKVKKDKQGPITRRSRRKRVKTKKDESSSEEEPYFQGNTFFKQVIILLPLLLDTLDVENV